MNSDLNLRSNLRIGHGIDFHKFTEKKAEDKENRKLILGGIEIPYHRGLLGHSDADVIIHALMDSMLGACGLPDIGHYFPPTDPKFKDADSGALLKEVCSLVSKKNFQIINTDICLVMESPKIAPFREKIVENIAGLLKISNDRVGFKATTTEGLGFVGRGEGVYASVTTLGLL